MPDLPASASTPNDSGNPGRLAVGCRSRAVVKDLGLRLVRCTRQAREFWVSGNFDPGEYVQHTPRLTEPPRLTCLRAPCPGRLSPDCSPGNSAAHRSPVSWALASVAPPTRRHTT